MGLKFSKHAGLMVGNTREPINLAFVGSDTENGTIDVLDLAPALLGFGGILTRANTVLNGNRAETSVRIRADFKKGSFTVDFDFWQSLASMLFDSGKVLSPREIMDTIGITGAICLENTEAIKTVISSVFGLLKAISDKKVSHVEKHENGNVSMQISGDVNAPVTIVNTTTNVYNLASDGEFRRGLDKALSALAKPGIDHLAIRENNLDVCSIDKTDAKSLLFRSSDLGEPEFYENERTQWYGMANVAFDNGMWRLTSGGDKISAVMRDQDFMERVRRSDDQFAAGDSILVTIKTMQRVFQDGKQETKSEIVKVLDHRRGQRQMALSPANLDEDGEH